MRVRDFGESVGKAVLRRVGRASSRAHETRGLGADVLEGDDEFLVVFDAPGADSSDVQVRYVEGDVEVRVDRFRPFHEGFEMLFPGRGLSLDGEASLPEGAHVDPDGATATLTQRGTLEVRIPKIERVDERATGSVALTDEEDADEEDVGELTADDVTETGDDGETLTADDVTETGDDDELTADDVTETGDDTDDA